MENGNIERRILLQRPTLFLLKLKKLSVVRVKLVLTVVILNITVSWEVAVFPPPSPPPLFLLLLLLLLHLLPFLLLHPLLLLIILLPLLLPPPTSPSLSPPSPNSSSPPPLCSRSSAGMPSMSSALLLFNFSMATWVSCCIDVCNPISPLCVCLVLF